LISLLIFDLVQMHRRPLLLSGLHRALRRVLHWEQWPLPFYQFPMGFVWLWYCWKARQPWFFSTANPGLTFGGFEGEGKWEMYAQLPPGTFPTTVLVPHRQTPDEALAQFRDSGLSYPVALKPDVGMKGLLVRKIENDAQLVRYHRAIAADYLIQEWVDLPVELGVFYVRYPHADTGTITGISAKELVYVYGNGHSTLDELMARHPQAAGILPDLRRKHADKLHDIVPLGQKYQLTIAANRRRGAKLHDMRHEIDAALTAVMDQLSGHSGQLQWGRFDIKCQSIEDLKQQQNYTVLEFNGAGAAPSHIYQAGLSFGQAWAEVAYNWQVLYEISQINRKNGVKSWSFWRGIRFLRRSRRYFKHLKQLDHEI
jgi:hypothetical protein